MIKLGITGGIGSGKTFVSSCLARRGIRIYDTDSQAKRLMLEHPCIREDLTALLGGEIYQGGILNKPLLAGYLFACPENALRINSIVHPRVREDFELWASACQGEDVVALESAILYESGFDAVVDAVVMVYAPVEVRLRRVMRRDGVAEEQVRVRMALQMSDEEKCRRADFVVVNDGVKALQPQIGDMLSTLKSRKGVE